MDGLLARLRIVAADEYNHVPFWRANGWTNKRLEVVPIHRLKNASAVVYRKNLDSFTAELLFTMCLSLTCRGVDTLPYTQSLSIAHD